MLPIIKREQDVFGKGEDKMNELNDQAYIFGSIFMMANRMQVLGDKFDRKITIKQWLFIVAVMSCNNEPKLSDVAHISGYSRQNAKRIAVNLEQKGFVRIDKDPNDIRALRITLTQSCMDYFAERRLREIEFINKLFNGFNEELTDGLYKGLEKLSKNIEEMENQYEENEE